MTENYSQIPPNSTGEKIRLFKNTVGLNDVSSEATTITDQTGQVMKNMGANGRVFVDGSEVTQPVSGTFWQTTQPVSGTVTANAGTGPWPVTDNGGSLTVDGSVTNLANSGVDIGDVTINNAAGAAAVNIQDGGNSITVDGSVSIVTSMVPGTAATNLGKAEDAVAASGDTGVAMLGVRNDAAAVKTSADGDYSMFATDSAGRIGIADLGGSVSIDDNAGSLTVDAPVGTPVFVRLSDGTAAISTLPVSGPLTDTQLRATAVPVSGTVTANAGTGTFNIQANASTNLAQVNGVTTQTGTGAAGTGTQRVAVASDSSINAVQSGTWTVQPGNTANTTPWLTTNTPATSGGYTISKTISAATTNATNVKASAGQLFGWYIYNDNNNTRYVKLHNTAGTPTAGAGVVMTIAIPGGSGANVEYSNGIAFSTGIAFTTVTGMADANATAVAANDLVINLFYK